MQSESIAEGLPALGESSDFNANAQKNTGWMGCGVGRGGSGGIRDAKPGAPMERNRIREPAAVCVSPTEGPRGHRRLADDLHDPKGRHTARCRPMVPPPREGKLLPQC